jgi:hypothetical protein
MFQRRADPLPSIETSRTRCNLREHNLIDPENISPVAKFEKCNSLYAKVSKSRGHRDS